MRSAHFLAAKARAVTQRELRGSVIYNPAEARGSVVFESKGELDPALTQTRIIGLFECRKSGLRSERRVARPILIHHSIQLLKTLVPL
jgi:hypothetical protein